MLIYTENISPRLQYIADFIGNYLLGVAAKTTNHKEEFVAFEGVKINYSNEPLSDNSFWIKPSSLLFENHIKQQEVDCFLWKEKTVFFKTAGDLPFDILAATFYLLSRYEEYLPHQKDKYGRYAHENSLAFQHHFLHQPLVQIWLEQFKEELIKKLSSASFIKHTFRYLPTYDIDQAFAYKQKGFLRTYGGLLKDFKNAGKRLSVISGKRKDPFDVFNELTILHNHYALNPIYFFHVGLKYGDKDTNISPNNTVMKNIIGQHAAKYEIGIHPSWRSGDEPHLLKEELDILEKISEKKITISRQHYLRFTLPTTYRRLIALGIEQEYSMGYGTINGFRASVAVPFYWYDLEKEETTPLQIHPFAFMESVSLHQLKQTPQQALQEKKQLLNEVNTIGGTFISIWHNSSFSFLPLFKGWSDMYKEFLTSLP